MELAYLGYPATADNKSSVTCDSARELVIPQTDTRGTKKLQAPEKSSKPLKLGNYMHKPEKMQPQKIPVAVL